MQRRLMKSLEDLRCAYDGSVRTSTGEMIQFIYGGDGLDPTYMEGKDRPVDFPHALEHCKATNPCHGEDPLDHEELIRSFNRIMEQDPFKTCGEDFRDDLK